MPRPHEDGIPARKDYERVRYFPFGVRPGTAFVLTAEPWAFLQAWLSQRIDGTRGVKRECRTRALYYCQQAEAFYAAANGVPLPTKGTLTYYGMLNLAKCFLSVRGIELEKVQEHHGLSLPQGSSFKVRVASQPSVGKSIFHLLADAMGTPVATQHDIPFLEVAAELPEIHEISFSLGHLPKRRFLPIDIDFLVNDGKEWLFTEILYDKKNESRFSASSFFKGARKSYFKPLPEREGRICYRSNARKKVTKKNWDRVYSNIIKDYQIFNIAMLLTRQGYKYYCNLHPGSYHHLCNSLMLMFYIGTVARYRPSETQRLMEGEYKPLLAEAVATCPTQFLYQITSYTTSSVCVVPQAKL